MEIIERIQVNNELFFLLLLLSFSFIVMLRAFYGRSFKLLILSVFSKRYAYKYLREDTVFTERVNVITFGILVINVSLWILKILDEDSISMFFLIAVIVVFFYLFKYLIIHFLGNIFLIKELSRLAIFFSLLFDRVFFVLLFPIIVFLYFSVISASKTLLIFSGGLFFVIMIFKIRYLYKIGANNFGIYPLYIFLYLCILEFFPIILLGKVFID